MSASDPAHLAVRIRAIRGGLAVPAIRQTSASDVAAVAATFATISGIANIAVGRGL